MAHSDRHTRRDFLVTTGAGAALLALTGCGSSGDDATVATTSKGPVTGTVRVRYWGAGIERTAWQDRIKYFEGKYPKVTVDSELLEKDGYQEFPALLTQLAAGNAPDVMRTLNYQPTQLVEQGGALLALDDLIASDDTFDQSDFVTAPWNAGKVGGKQYAIPQNGESYIVLFNAEAFKRAGLTDPQKQFEAGTWDQDAFRTAAEALQARGGVKHAVGFESWNYDNFIFMGGGTVLDDQGNVTIDQDPNARTLQFLADMAKEGLSPSPLSPNGTSFQAFSSGQLGMFIGGSWWPVYMPRTSFAWQTAPQPSFWGHLGCKVEVDALTISADTKNPEAAWAFAKTVTDREGLTIWSKVALPTRDSVLQSPAVQRNPYVHAAIEMVKHGTFTPFTKAGAGIDTAATNALAPMWLGKTTAADALAKAAQDIQDRLANA